MLRSNVGLFLRLLCVWNPGASGLLLENDAKSVEMLAFPTLLIYSDEIPAKRDGNFAYEDRNAVIKDLQPLPDALFMALAQRIDEFSQLPRERPTDSLSRVVMIVGTLTPARSISLIGAF